MSLSKMVNILRKNKILVSMFVLSTGFFIWQHTTGLSWDFVAYVLNARYFFFNGAYFEWLRSPLAPFLLGILGIFGWKASEYLFIVLCSSLYLFACIKFSKKFNVDPAIFYGISLTPFLLVYGLFAGTELLSLALLMLLFTYYDKPAGGFFFGLSYLARSTNLIFFPVLFFNRRPKKILASLFLVFLTVLPWFLYNYFLTGSALTNFIDGYASQISFRSYMHMPFSFAHILFASGYLLILFFFGIIIKAKEIRNSLEKKKEMFFVILMILVIVITLYSYAKIPFKTERYLFNLILPLSYFSAIAVKKMGDKFIYFFILFSFFIIFFTPIYPPSLYTPDLSSPDFYKQTISGTGSLIGNCSLRSNGWVFLNYFGQPSGPALHSILVSCHINQGDRFLLFKSIGEPDYTFNKTFLSQFPVLKETEDYILLGKNVSCTGPGRFDKTYIQGIQEIYKIGFNESYSISLYELLFTDKSA